MTHPLRRRLQRPGPLLVALALTGCVTTGPQRPLDQADLAFTRGDLQDAAGAYARAEDEAGNRDERLRARLFALIARTASSAPGALDPVHAELRAFAVEARASHWGRLAGLYADEMAQAEALRWAVQRAGADLEARRLRIAELEAELAHARQEATDLSETIATLKDEKAQQQRSTKELEEQLATNAALLASLEAELAALKRIDMSRTP